MQSREHVEVVLLDDPVQVDIDEVLARCRSPVPDDEWLNVRQFERAPQQRIVVQVELTDRHVVRGPPIRVHLVEQLGRKSFSLHA